MGEDWAAATDGLLKQLHLDRDEASTAFPVVITMLIILIIIKIRQHKDSKIAVATFVATAALGQMNGILAANLHQTSISTTTQQKVKCGFSA